MQSIGLCCSFNVGTNYNCFQVKCRVCRQSILFWSKPCDKSKVGVKGKLDYLRASLWYAYCVMVTWALTSFFLLCTRPQGASPTAITLFLDTAGAAAPWSLTASPTHRPNPSLNPPVRIQAPGKEQRENQVLRIKLVRCLLQANIAEQLTTRTGHQNKQYFTISEVFVQNAFWLLNVSIHPDTVDIDITVSCECLPVLCAALTSPFLRTSLTQVLTFSLPSPPTTDTTRLGKGRPQRAVIRV